MTTPQQQADAYLAAWRLCAALEIEPELRLPLIDVLCELERAKLATATRSVQHQLGLLPDDLPVGTKVRIRLPPPDWSRL